MPSPVISYGGIANKYGADSFFFFFCFLGRRPWARGLHHSHSNARSEPHLPPTPQLTATPDLNPLSEARGGICILMVPSRIHFHGTMIGTPENEFL